MRSPLLINLLIDKLGEPETKENASLTGKIPALLVEIFEGNPQSLEQVTEHQVTILVGYFFSLL